MRLLVLAPLAGALVAGCSAPTGVVRGPMLQQTTERSTLVSWHTAPMTARRVEWGLAPGVYDRVAGDGTVSRKHVVRLDGLAPGTRAWYRVRNPDGGWAEGSFRTLPARGDGGALRVWVLGDSGTGGWAQRNVRDAMVDFLGEEPADLLVHVGDIAYESGTEEEMQEHFFDAYRKQLPGLTVWPALGNHEAKSVDAAKGSGPWFDAFTLPTKGEAGGLPSRTEAYYSFDAGDTHWVVLDSSKSSKASDGPMLEWLRADLASSDATWTIAVFHHPPYSKGSHDSDTEKGPTAMRENALPILEAAGVDLVFTGHSHGYERTALIRGAYATPALEAEVLDGEAPYEKERGGPGTIYVTAGHGGRGTGGDFDHPLNVVNREEHGSVLLDFDGPTLRLRNVEDDGTVTDDFELRKR
ncbi:metallophosphoesterase [Vulgatibacter sp.]|uniref:metallophosphoesterase n=1 Tax=Vulgatibacter sp. TaxID=1971226 RepID=UPI003563B769